MKYNKKYKSTTCPKYCDGIGCYDTHEKRKIMGKWFNNITVSHCKSLAKLEKKLLG